METAYQSDIGQQRSENQDRVDSFATDAGMQLDLVADGIGGNRGGDVAAQTTVQTLGQRFLKSAPNDEAAAKQWLADQVQQINDQIIDESRKNESYQGMGTTLVAAIFFNDRQKIVIANIGDSRGYIMHQNVLTQVTIDHSLVNELVKNGDLTEQEAAVSPQNNIITRAIGISHDAQIDVNVFPFEPGDQLLMCSDGLSKTVDKQELTQVLQSDAPLKDKCSVLVEKANAAGGPDNITVLISQNDQER